MLTDRTHRTEEKTRRGDLPAPMNTERHLGVGSGMKCDGCGDTVAPFDLMCTTKARGLVELYFHVDCYQVWKDCKTA